MMHDQSRGSTPLTFPSRLCRLQYNRWPFDSSKSTGRLPSFSSSETVLGGISSSFYFPHPSTNTELSTPNYVNYDTPSTAYERPRSTIVNDSMTNSQQPSTFHVNDLRQRFESKAIVGIVKPMIHQRSQLDLNSTNYHDQTKAQEIPAIGNSYHLHSLRSLPRSSPSPSPSISSVVYRNRLATSQNKMNGPPPVIPRRYSSISNHSPHQSKSFTSHRSSRTTSTSSSIIALNDLSSSQILSDEQEQLNENTIIIDVKRLEMFYGSVGTQVKAARSIARLYTATTRQLANFEDWSSQQTGVPLWIYNTGANLKRTRQVTLMLVQHDSCFALWSSMISHQAEVRLPKDNHITCWLPETNTLVVFKFERDDACRLFFRHYHEILQHERRMNLANPPPLPAENAEQERQQGNQKEIPRRYSRLRTLTHKPDKEQQQQQFELRRCRSLSKIRTVKKSDISGPINFEHVNHIGNDSQKSTASSLSGTVSLRSLHASMSNLPSIGSIAERFSKQNKKRASASFEPRSTAV